MHLDLHYLMAIVTLMDSKTYLLTLMLRLKD